MQHFSWGRLSLPSGHSQSWQSLHCAALSWWDHAEKAVGARCPVPWAERWLRALCKAVSAGERAAMADGLPPPGRPRNCQTETEKDERRVASETPIPKIAKGLGADEKQGRRVPRGGPVIQRPVPLRGASAAPGVLIRRCCDLLHQKNGVKCLCTDHLSSLVTFTVIRWVLQFQ